MVINEKGLNFVAVGDWNKTYYNPNWIVNNLFSGENVSLEFSFDSGNDNFPSLQATGKYYSVQAFSNRFIIICMNDTEESLKAFSNICSLFCNKTPSPYVNAYGFNLRCTESSSTEFASTVDSLSDHDQIIRAGAVINETSIKRTVSLNSVEYMIVQTIVSNQIIIDINENHPCDCESKSIKIMEGSVESFLNNCMMFLNNLGYKLETEVDLNDNKN